MSKYSFYGFWTPLDVVAIVTNCLSFLDDLSMKKDVKHTLDIPKARKEYQTVLEILSRFEKSISFYDITSQRVRAFVKIDNDFYTENVILKRAKAAEWSGLSTKDYLDTLIKEDATKFGAAKFLNDMKDILGKPNKNK